jgi:putative ABC transport system substrate-binding protein
MRRRELLLGAAASSLLPLPLGAQQGPVRHIGVLMMFTAEDPEAKLRVTAFESGLRDLGWIKGRNLQIEYRWAAGDTSALRAYAAELTRMAPDLILANATPVIAALREQGRSVPTLFTQVTDPIGMGLVTSLAQPGGNVTGFTNFEFTIGTKWLETLKIVAPAVTRLALVYNPQTAPFADLFRRPVQAAAASFDVTLATAAASGAAELEQAIGEFARSPGGGLMVLPDVSTANQRDRIIAGAAQHRLPAVYPYRFFAVSGGLVSYGSDLTDVFRRAAGYADRILKGARPGDLPIQAPVKYELAINLKTARALGLNAPPLLLARADEVIE